MKKSSKLIYYLLGIFLILMIIGLGSKAYFGNSEEAKEVTPADGEIIYGAGSDSIDDYLLYLAEEEDSPSISASAIHVEPIKTSSPQKNNPQKGPNVIIYHTHTCEAYKRRGSDNYEETALARTNNQSYNVVSVGNQFAKWLYQEYKINSSHDLTNHEPPKLATAYARSLETMSKYTKPHDKNTIFIDIHRDAYNRNSWNPSHVIINGKRVARIMFVVGMGKGFDDKPEWKKNLDYAEQMTKELNKIHPNLARQVKIKDGRYNQHMSEMCILVEIGHHENSLQEALNATEYLAKAVNQTFFK
jgi:stage II sporulation protein P